MPHVEHEKETLADKDIILVNVEMYKQRCSQPLKWVHFNHVIVLKYIFM